MGVAFIWLPDEDAKGENLKFKIQDWRSQQILNLES
jgi:hypothetical protein